MNLHTTAIRLFAFAGENSFGNVVGCLAFEYNGYIYQSPHTFDSVDLAESFIPKLEKQGFVRLSAWINMGKKK